MNIAIVPPKNVFTWCSITLMLLVVNSEKQPNPLKLSNLTQEDITQARYELGPL